MARQEVVEGDRRRLVIGAGPSGLFVTAELARHGVQARLVERDLAPHREARATSLKPGTLEILESVGLVDPILEAALALREVKMYDHDLSELRTMTVAGLECRYEFQASLPQYETERILHDHLVSLGGRVELGVAATAVEPDGHAVHVELTHADGRVETATPDVVIGADGAHSVTRHSMDEPLTGTTYQGYFLAADVAMDTPFPAEQAQFVFGRDGMILLAPMPGGRFITFQDLEEGVDSVTGDEVASRTEARLGGRWRPSEIAWASPFHMQRRIVSRLADRRRYLVGDAAHASSPFAGEGMNSGLQDGYDLAWKLALVVHGRAPTSLFDAYHLERRIPGRGGSGAGRRCRPGRGAGRWDGPGAPRRPHRVPVDVPHGRGPRGARRPPVVVPAGPDVSRPNWSPPPGGAGPPTRDGGPRVVGGTDDFLGRDSSSPVTPDATSEEQ